MTNVTPHAVCFPLLAQGHINAMLHFANALHFMGFHITFVNTDFNYRRILRKHKRRSSHDLLPFLADQQPNCRYLCLEWGIGMEIREEVKRKALEWKARAVKAASYRTHDFSLERSKF